MITLPSSEYFNLRAIGKGVYAAIAKDGSPAFSNAGVVDTGDHILIFDTFNTFHAAVDLQRDIEIITKRLANYVVISHSHADHWMGNQVFADHATILASRQTTDAMIEWAKYFQEHQRNLQAFRDDIKEIEARLAKAKDHACKRIYPGLWPSSSMNTRIYQTRISIYPIRVLTASWISTG